MLPSMVVPVLEMLCYKRGFVLVVLFWGGAEGGVGVFAVDNLRIVKENVPERGVGNQKCSPWILQFSLKF